MSQDIPNQLSWSASETHFSEDISHEKGCITLDSSYTVQDNWIKYDGANDMDAEVPFSFGYLLPTTWFPHVLHKQKHGDNSLKENIHFTCTFDCDESPDCVYRCGLYARILKEPCLGAWEVLCENGSEWSHGTPMVMKVSSQSILRVYTEYRNKLLDQSTAQHVIEPVLVLTMTRIDFGQRPTTHQLELKDLSMDVESASEEKQNDHLDITSLTSIKTLSQLEQPIAVLNEDMLLPYANINTDAPIMIRFLIKGQCKGISNLSIIFRPVNYPPTIVQAWVTPTSFEAAAQPLFPSTVSAIDILLSSDKFDTTNEMSSMFEIEITNLQAIPSSIDTKPTSSIFQESSQDKYEFNELHDAIDFGTITQLKQQVDKLGERLQQVEKAEGPPGKVGKRGPKGERGEALRFEDLANDQKEQLRGQRGAPGPRGKQMVFEDLTLEQRALLKGNKGCTGSTGKEGERGPRGLPGKSLTFDDLTEVQREMIRGEKGQHGEKGDALVFEDLSEAQRKAIKGERGEKGIKGDTGARGERGRIGPLGPAGPEGKQGPRGLPGVPGAKGDRGRIGESGKHGRHGRPAIIKTSFTSVDLLRDFVHKSLQLVPNTYYIIDQSDSATHLDTNEHGMLYVYSGTLEIELVVGCTYVENIKAILEEFNAVLRSKVQSDLDEWCISLTIQSDDVGVYHLRRGLENSIVQNGYSVKKTLITQDALQSVGRLCGAQGQSGERGSQGIPGQSMLGMRLDHIGTEAGRLKLRSPEANTIFLQVQPSKNHIAGFYIFDATTSQWKLLHGVNVANSFLEWMTAFVENPNQESIPLVLSMFATTKKQMDGSVQNVRQELVEYKNSNEKWKKFQFENWKSMGSSQYQQFNAQLSEQNQTCESLMQQIQIITEKSAGRDELSQLRKLVEKQVENVERQCKTLKSGIANFAERQTVDKHVFEQEQEEVQSKLRDVDASILKMLKIIQYLKTAPWNKPFKVMQQDIDHLSLEHSTHWNEQVKLNKDVQSFMSKEFPEAFKTIQVEVGEVLEKIAASEVALDRKFVEWGDTYDKRLLAASTDHTETTMRIQKELLAHSDKLRAETISQLSTKLFTLKQEFLEITNELREGVSEHEHDTKRNTRNVEKKIEEVEQYFDGVIKKHSVQNDSQWKNTNESFKEKLEQLNEKTSKEIDRKLLQTVDALQHERRESQNRYTDQIKDVTTSLNETKTDLMNFDERWELKFEDQRQKQTNHVEQNIDRLRSDLLKQLQENIVVTTEKVEDVKKDSKEQNNQFVYDIKHIGTRINDVDTKLKDDIERQTLAVRTQAEERLREYDQKTSNTIQSVKNDIQSIDSKCNNVDYMLKARLESIEEHIQQLYTESKEQCESLVNKNKGETLNMIEVLRNDIIEQQQKAIKSLTDQVQRYERSFKDKHSTHSDQLERVKNDIFVLEKRNEEQVKTNAKKSENHTTGLEQLRSDLQESVRQVLVKLNESQDQMKQELQELKRDVRAQLQTKCEDVSVKSTQEVEELNTKIKQQYENRNFETETQLKKVHTVLEDVITHVDDFMQKETSQRKLHEIQVQNITTMLNKMFGEMMSEQQ